MIDSYDPDGSLEQAHRAHQTAFAAAGDDHKAEGVGLKAAEVENERLRAYALQIEQENGEMRREIERLRAALQKVEWAQAVKDGDDVLYSCPGCGNPKDAGRHHPECPIGVALANSKPD